MVIRLTLRGERFNEGRITLKNHNVHASWVRGKLGTIHTLELAVPFPIDTADDVRPCVRTALRDQS